MTILISPQGAASAQLEGNGAGGPGAAPVGSSMQGNPSQSSYQPNGVQPPVPIVGPVVTTNAFGAVPALPDQISNGQIPLNVQPTQITGTPINVAPGGDSLLAMLSRGLIVYGRLGTGSLPGFNNSGANQSGVNSGSPQFGSPPLVLSAGNTGSVNTASPPNYTGN